MAITLETAARRARRAAIWLARRARRASQGAGSVSAVDRCPHTSYSLKSCAIRSS